MSKKVVATGSAFIVGFLFNSDTKPFHDRRFSGFVEPNTCNASARVISIRDQARKKIDLAIGDLWRPG